MNIDRHTIILSLLLNSIIIGFSIAAPVGPIGVLCIRRTLADGRITGLVSGLGAATADALYGFIAAFGMTALMTLLTDNAAYLQLFGGAFLVYLGIRTLRARPSEKAASVQNRHGGLIGAYTSTFFLTLTNPLTILSFMGIFSGLGLANTGGSTGESAIIVLGVFAGSALWWLGLSTAVGLLRERFNAGIMLWVNRLSGTIILFFGLRILGEFLLS